MAETIYALYRTMETAATAVNEVMKTGILSNDISVITRDPDNKYGRYIDMSHDDVDAEEGMAFGTIVGALTGLAVAAIPGFGPVFAAGPLAAALMAGVGAGAGAVTGGISAALIDFGADESDVEYYTQILNEGGALVIIEAHTEHEENMIENILAAYYPLELED